MDKKIKVAIIDSGILGSRNYQISESINYYVIGEDIMTNQDVEDFCGHGTACAHMIHRLCTDVEFKIVKVFDSTLFTHPALECVSKVISRRNYASQSSVAAK